MKLFYRVIAIAIFLWFSFCPLTVLAEDSLTIATWNVGFIDRSVDNLDLDGFLEEADFDILIVNEIKQERDLNQLKSRMNRADFFSAMSSFDRGNNGLEVGIISRYPLTNIVEYDRSLDGSGGIVERKLERVNVRGIADVGVGRGFLVAEVPELKLFVIATHLKSSRGRSGERDRSNAQKRELVAAAISEEVFRLREINPDYSVIVGGDINVGVTDSNKNGIDLSDDSNDGYDDTHAILELGLINGLQMRSLAKNVDGTFVGNDNIPDFPGTGAIDVLYVVGSIENDFGSAQATSERFGSDHLGVFATTGFIRPNPNPEEVTEIEIINALPNPVGEDTGKETITIANNSEGVVDISGWTLRDRANNTYTFPAETILEAGNNEIILPPNVVPLNNGGDSIELLNTNGDRIGAIFIYSRNDVEIGLPVR